MADAAFLGAGPAFPFAADAGGSVLLRHGASKVEESIRLILSTRPGERAMRPEFGCAAHEYVFAPAGSPRTVGLVVRAVEDALTRWEPRIDLQAVTAAPGPGEGELVVSVDYVLRATNDARNLVHPFYAIVPEGGGAS